MMRPIFLLTDFGLHDAFAGIMKAVICRLAPGAPIFDLTHAVPPQNLRWGALVLEDALPHLPADAIVCAVVDPGVGGERKALLAESGGRSFIAPDNGLLWPVLMRAGGEFQAFALRPNEHIRPQDSATFHGRDVFAPAAALRAAGAAAESLGGRVDRIERLDFPRPEPAGGTAIRLTILAADHFGNLTLNLRRGEVPLWWNEGSVAFHFSGKMIQGIRRTFSDAAPGESVVYWNSAGRLELAVNRGNARRELGLEPGGVVKVESDE